MSRPSARDCRFPFALSAGKTSSFSVPGRRRWPDLRRPVSPIAGEGSSWSSTWSRPTSSGDSWHWARRCASLASTPRPREGEGSSHSSGREAARCSSPMLLPKSSGGWSCDRVLPWKGGMLDQLRYFQAVARCGSLSAAARVLQVSQPGLTAVIKQLEEGFGTKLLVRLRTGVSLTSTGKELLRFADESLARRGEGGDLEAAKERLRHGPLVFAGRIPQSQQIIDQLAAMDALPSRLLPCGDLELVKSFALAGLGVGVLPRRVARYCQDGRLRRLHPALPFIADEIHLLFRGDAHRTRAFLITKEAIVAHGRALDGDYEE